MQLNESALRWFETVSKPSNEDEREAMIRLAEKAYILGDIDLEQFEKRLDLALDG